MLNCQSQWFACRILAFIPKVATSCWRSNFFICFYSRFHHLWHFIMFYLNCLGLVVSMSDLDIYVLDYIPSGGCSSQDFRRIKKCFNPGEGIKIPPEIKLRFNLARQKAKKFNMPSRFVWPKHVSLIGWDFLIVRKFDWKDLHCKICTKQTSAELRISRKWFLSNCHSSKWVILKTQPSLSEAQQTSIRYNQYTKNNKKTYTIQLAFRSLEGLRCPHLKKHPVLLHSLLRMVSANLPTLKGVQLLWPSSC